MPSDTIRKNVPLTKEELDLLEASRNEGSPAYEALRELVGPAATRSEAAALHGALALGLEVIRERVALHGYTALAASQDEEDRAFRSSMRNRRRDEKD